MLNNRKIKSLSGIYQIKNLINNKIYIGSTVNLYNRFHSHKSKLKLKCHSCKHLQNAYHKYGSNNFIFEVLIYCDETYIINIEQQFINKLNPEYNKREIAESNSGYSHSDETKEKISETLKEKYESGEKVTYKQQHNWRKVEQYSLEGEYIQTFNYPTEAANYLNCYNSVILRALNREDRICLSHQWKYEDEDIIFGKAVKTGNGSRKIHVLDTLLNKEHVFESIKLYAEHMNTHKSSIQKVLARENNIYKNRYIISYQA